LDLLIIVVSQIVPVAFDWLAMTSRPGNTRMLLGFPLIFVKPAYLSVAP